MIVFEARNVQHALINGIHAIRRFGVERASRNGPVVQFPSPVTTTYLHPEERVLLCQWRDANPFFHLFEALWMLGGRNDLGYVQHMVARFREYSDDGITLHGAYGHRWRRAFGFDQLDRIVERLRADPDDRRCVLQMWDAGRDLVPAKERRADLPCNTHAYPVVNVRGELELTVCNRSNDLVWGAYGANAVHFSLLQEYLAARLGRPLGRCHQVSNNLHAYREVLDGLPERLDDTHHRVYNNAAGWNRVPVAESPIGAALLDRELPRFLDEDDDACFESPFLCEVAIPMRWAYLLHRDKSAGNPVDRTRGAIRILEQDCRADDWRAAGVEWLQRRLQKLLREADDGVQHGA